MIVKNRVHRMFTYFTMVMTLSDFMEANDLPESLEFKQQIKFYTRELRKLLPEAIDRMIKKTSMDSNLESIDQYVQASQIMEHLFNVGLRIEDMENETKKQTLITQLNILLHSYGLPQLELIVSQDESTQLKEDNESEQTRTDTTAGA